MWVYLKEVFVFWFFNVYKVIYSLISCVFLIFYYFFINIEEWLIILVFIVMLLIRMYLLGIDDWIWWVIVYEFYSNLVVDLLVFDELKLY